MPIDLMNLKTTNTAVAFCPKFFARELTGSGGSRGVLSKEANPKYIPDEDKLFKFPPDLLKTHRITDISTGIVQNQYQWPLVPFSDTILHKYVNYLDIDLSSMINIQSKKDNCRVSIKLEPYRIQFTSTRNKYTQTTNKHFVCQYRLIVAVTKDEKNPVHKLLKKGGYSKNKTSKHQDNYVYTTLTTDPYNAVNYVVNYYDGCSKITQDYLDDYCLYSEIQEQSKHWNKTLHNDFERIFEGLSQQLHKDKSAHTLRPNDILNLRQCLSQLALYKIPLDIYISIYQLAKKHLGPSIVEQISKFNLNLLLSNTLDILSKNNDDNLLLMPPKNKVQIKDKLSLEQRKAVQSEDPLVITQAGAGTGKSTVLLARIKHLIANGANPEDITVLSFTNAAADNIKNKNPNVNSMTIASMIDSIYKENYSHKISSMSTLVNSLDIFIAVCLSISLFLMVKFFSSLL